MEVIRDYRDRLGSLRLVADVAAFEAMRAARPLSPPGPRLLEEAASNAGARDAAKALARAPRVELEDEGRCE